jgi:hypothetical protein
MKIESLGRPAHFFIPGAKWDCQKYSIKGKVVRRLIQEFLLKNYGGYTFREGDMGMWRPKYGATYEDSMLEVKVAFKGKERIPKLQKFLAKMCKLMEEECIYLETGEDSWLIYP